MIRATPPERHEKRGQAVMEIHEALTLARDQIADPVNWCGNGARNERGGRCAVVALSHVIELHGASDLWVALYKDCCKALLEAVGWNPRTDVPGLFFGTYNDTHTHREVMSAFYRAIQATKPSEVEVVGLVAEREPSVLGEPVDDRLALV